MKKKTLKILSIISTLAITPLITVKYSYAGSEPTIGEISYFAGNFAPRGYAFCDGQLLAISQNTALFSLLGTTYGGDGRTTFALPDMRGRVALHEGNGPGLTRRQLGAKLGSESTSVLPEHSHQMNVSSDSATTTTATNRSLASTQIYKNDAASENLHANTLSTQGGGQTITNVQPSITARCIIALIGTYPSRS
jgi:microcystin-dependent protein